MKVIKDNRQEKIKEMMAYVDSAVYPVIDTCSSCNSVLEIQKEDLNLKYAEEEGLLPVVECPVCNKPMGVGAIKTNIASQKQVPINFSVSNWRYWIKFFVLRLLILTVLILIAYFIL